MASLLKAFGNQLNPAGVPNGKLLIDWNHPLANGLIFCRVGDQTVDLTGYNGTGVAGSAGGNSLNPPGFSIEGSALLTQYIGTGSGIDIEFGSVPSLYTGGNCTFVSRFVLKSYSTPSSVNSGLMSYGKNGDVAYNLAMSQNLGNVAMFEVQNSAISYQNVTAIAPAVNVVSHWTGIVRGANILLIQDNVINSAGYTGTPINGNSTYTLAVGRDWWSNDVGRWSNAWHHLDLIYNRALSNDEAFYLYANPYCFLVPAEYELPAVGIAAAPQVVAKAAARIFRPGRGPSWGLFTARSTFISPPSFTLVAVSASFVLTGQAAPFDIKMPTVAGSFALTGQAAPEGIRLVSTFGSFAETGEPITFGLGMPTVAGSFALTGFAATLTTTGDTSMPAVTGSFTLTGEPISFDLAEAAVAGSFALTGNAATLTATSSFTMAAAVGSFVLTGEPAPLDARLGVTFAPFALTGQPVAFDIRMATAFGAYASTGFDAALSTTGSQSMPAVPGFFNLTGIDVSFLLPSAQPGGGAGYVSTFSRKRWKELLELIAAEKAVAAKARKVGSPARAEALAKASRKAQDAIFALEDVNGRESYERDMERLRAHLATAAAAKKTADSIREAHAAAVLAAQLAAEAQDEQELMLLLDDGPSAARDIERITAMMANLLK